MDKRDFLRTACGAASWAVLGGRLGAGEPNGSTPAGRGRGRPVPGDPVPPPASADFWAQLRSRYRLPKDRIDLEHGFYSRMADDVLEGFVAAVRAVNVDAAFYMRTRQADDKRRVRERLAAMAGCSAEELVITRNTTEALDTVIAGLDWRSGDEAVMAAQDYGAMLQMFAQIERRHGITRRIVSLPLDPTDDDQVVRLYRDAITERTRLVLVSHVVNITGHVLPVARICAVARERGVPVLVDGAHAFAQLEFRVPELGCDYYGTSLHKWLGSPIGAGFLYVRRDRIRELWPLFGDDHPDDRIEKLNHTGTHPPHTDLAIEPALRLHEQIGGTRKLERLRFLHRYWTEALRDEPRLVWFTPRQEQRTCAIATVGVDGLAPATLAKRLLDEHRIHTVAIDGAGVHGVRVTPQLYTTTDELDLLVAALRSICRS